MKAAQTKTWAKIVQVGPKEATHLLSGNRKNRRVKQRHVNQLAKAMVDGQWVMNGEAIVVAKSGRLLDGQHRLMAVVESGCKVPMLVVEVDQDEDLVFDTIDRGHKRSTADTLEIAGAKYSACLAAALLLVYQYRNAGMARRDGATTTDLVKLLKKEAGLQESVALVNSPAWREASIMMPTSSWAFVHHILRDAGAQRDAFLDECCVRALPGDAVRALRGRLVPDMRTGRPGLGKIEKLALTVKAWNLFATNQPCEVLRWSKTEGFPLAELPQPAKTKGARK